MGISSSIKVGYKVTLLEQIISIFCIEGRHLRTYAKRKNKNKGHKGIEFGGRPHLLDAMIIMKPIWEDNEGKYTRVDGIKRCWRKSNILPVSWEFDTSNYAGLSSVPIIMKTLNKDYCENIFNLLETLSVKSKESGVNVSREYHGIKGSLFIDGSFTNLKLGQWLKTGYR